LLAAARAALTSDERFRFVRRTITRPADAGGEAHQPVTEAEFAALRFALSWQAHGLHYGIPADIEGDLAAGRVVVASVSRTVIAIAARRFRVHVIEITAPPDLLAVRLLERGREATSDVAARLTRSIALPPGIPVETIVNDATIERGAARFVAGLSRLAEDGRSAGTDDPARSG
jgi:phosphonate metabolism protein PhnN/1,5-bisphosphokinase (PRPP-forming)